MKTRDLFIACLSFAVAQVGAWQRPEIAPEWIGARPGVWTMDLTAATNAAAATGHYTVFMTSGQWWCPDCTSFDAHVLSAPAWTQYVQEQGYYLAMVDYPYRDGVKGWTWLWDTNYVETVATNLTMESAAEEVVRRYQIEDFYSAPGAKKQTINGVDYGRIA